MMKLLFHKELDDLVEAGKISLERKRKLEKWVTNAEHARKIGSLDSKLNQYDKAEELLTWYTFAPLFRMSEEQRFSTINEIIEPLVGPNVLRSSPTMTFEKMLLPSDDYLDTVTFEHPVKYIRKEIVRHREKNANLEGHTHIDFFLETDELIISIEAKFTSDIENQVTYNYIRNQIARTIDVSIEAAKKSDHGKKVVFLLCVPKYLYNSGRFYYYKMKDYEDIETLKRELPHQMNFDQYYHSSHVVFWGDIVSIILKHANRCGLISEEINKLKRFYEERLIKLTIDNNCDAVWNRIKAYTLESKGEPLDLLSKRGQYHVLGVSEDHIRIDKLPIKLTKEMFLYVHDYLGQEPDWVRIGASRVNTEPTTIEGILKAKFFEGNPNALSTASWISAILVNAKVGVSYNQKRRGQAIKID